MPRVKVISPEEESAKRHLEFHKQNSAQSWFCFILSCQLKPKYGGTDYNTMIANLAKLSEKELHIIGVTATDMKAVERHRKHTAKEKQKAKQEQIEITNKNSTEAN